MELQLGLVLGLLVMAILMFAWNKPRMDSVGILMMILLPFTGVITFEEALRGFSDPNVVLIAALFVIGDGLVRTGVARSIGDWISDRAANSENRLVSMLMAVVCSLGSTMSSTAVTAIFIPITMRISQKTGIPSTRLMMPLSFAALISGMMTLVATAPNLVINSELIRAGNEGFSFFAFTPVGVVILAIGILYMLFMKRTLKSAELAAESKHSSRRPSLLDWVAKYELKEREYLVRILNSSIVCGRRLDEMRLRSDCGAGILAIKRKESLIQPTGETVLEAGDLVLIDLHLPTATIESLSKTLGVENVPLSGFFFADSTQQIGLVEVLVPEDSDLVGQTLMESSFRGRTGLTVIGLRRQGKALPAYLKEETLQVGDTLLLIGSWRAIKNVHQNIRVLPLQLPKEMDDVVPAPGKGLAAIACLLLTIGLMVSGVIANSHAAFIGCILMGATGCISLESVYKSVDWKTLLLIVGMLPFALALQRTGAVDIASKSLMQMTQGGGSYAILSLLFICTTVLGMFISNTATAVLMAPVALNIAANLEASPYPFAMIVAIAASTAFMTPVSSPVNTLVVTPGNYQFSDFVRVGVPFSVLVMLVTVLLVPILFPLWS